MVVSFCALAPCPSKKNDVIIAVTAVFKENVLMVCLCFARFYQIYCQSFLCSLVVSKLILPPPRSIGGLLTFPIDFGSCPEKSTRNIRRVSKALVQSVLSELGKAPRPGVNYKQPSARLGIKDDKGRQKVQAALEQLLSEGRIKSGQTGRFELIIFDQQSIVGRVDMTQSGAAYVVVPEQEGDIYIPPKRLKQALDGDLVKVRAPCAKAGRKSGR